MKKLSAGEKELVANYIIHLKDLRKDYLTCPQQVTNINPVMNIELLAIAESINDVIQREMESCKEDGVSTTYTEQLEYLLSEIKDSATRLYYPNYTK